MYRLTRNLQIIAFITIIILVSGWYYQHNTTNQSITQSTRQAAELSVKSISSDIGSELAQHGRTIEAAAVFIGLQQWEDEEILSYLETLLEQNESFHTIYYGTTDNDIINASGWVPPEHFDLRERPWYIKAINKKEIVYTEAFINASEDSIIVTAACPVYNSSGKLLGVAGGDISIEQIATLVQNKNSELFSHSFLVDSRGNVLAHPELDYNPDAGFITIEEINGKLAEIHNNSDRLSSPILLDEKEGYLAYLPVDNTDWHLATFIPFEAMQVNFEQMSTEYFMAGAVILLVFLLFVLYHNFYIYRPLLDLENHIKQIDIEKDAGYRIPVKKYGEFAFLGKTMNKLLNKVHTYLKKLEDNEVSLKASNNQLESILRQLTTAEEALDYSEEKLYYLSYHDQLTGLYNRSFFEARMIQLSEKPEYPTTIISTDIDGLKLINDTIGQSAGNRLLKKCAGIVSETLNGEGILARVGGDEFSAILPLVNKDEGEKIARKIRYQVNYYTKNNTNLPLSLSIGVATAEDRSVSLKKLFKMAEDQMVRNKLHRNGSARNSVVCSLVTA
ncbi:MAG: cache domain-containing protein, partial [Bacillota bacterium]